MLTKNTTLTYNPCGLFIEAIRAKLSTPSILFIRKDRIIRLCAKSDTNTIDSYILANTHLFVHDELGILDICYLLKSKGNKTMTLIKGFKSEVLKPVDITIHRASKPKNKRPKEKRFKLSTKQLKATYLTPNNQRVHISEPLPDGSIYIIEYGLRCKFSSLKPL